MHIVCENGHLSNALHDSQNGELFSVEYGNKTFQRFEMYCYIVFFPLLQKTKSEIEK